MQSKKMQLARALVFASTLSGILVGNLLFGYWLGGKIEEYGWLEYGRIVGIVAGMTNAVYSTYITIKRDFIGSVSEHLAGNKKKDNQDKNSQG